MHPQKVGVLLREFPILVRIVEWKTGTLVFGLTNGTEEIPVDLVPPRVQVPNSHTLTPNLYCNYDPKPLNPKT